MRWSVLVLAALLALALSHGRLWSIPDQHNPWAPLALEEAPGWLTRHKLSRLEQEPGACRAFVAAAGFDAKAQSPRAGPEGCGFDDAVLLRRTAGTVLAPTLLSCRAAASLALWERHVLQPAAQRHFGVPVRRLEHFGSYACRRVYGREAGAWSRHARADALDLAGVVLADGRRVRVLAHWTAGGAEAAFLHELHAGACGFFDGVFGPDYNHAHADHLHLDRGPYRLCR
ncbi:extensin-like domain-containing protein [Rubrivivax gelatinosus]|uniref:Extensin-like protein n=1 Tax=Rubrivivax gelatinosus TaxID=28068 RepID=A0A4R2LUB0_RUBGE|nr:extensin family protein [Rubrivivax gelatinosus]MBK1690032.1 extensin [Rubrivivax gelatinosus]TCO97661.1 extensin-like protein [Rubrivivax gelatinosus]